MDGLRKSELIFSIISSLDRVDSFRLFYLNKRDMRAGLFSDNVQTGVISNTLNYFPVVWHGGIFQSLQYLNDLIASEPNG